MQLTLEKITDSLSSFFRMTVIKFRTFSGLFQHQSPISGLFRTSGNPVAISILCDYLSHLSAHSDSIAPDTRWYGHAPACTVTWIFAPAGPLCHDTRPRKQKTQTEPAVIVTENDQSVDAWSKINCYTQRLSTERPSGTDCYRCPCSCSVKTVCRM